MKIQIVQNEIDASDDEQVNDKKQGNHDDVIWDEVQIDIGPETALYLQ